jgi:hypothetical protein
MTALRSDVQRSRLDGETERQRPLFIRRRWVETKNAFKTTELLTLALAVAGILVAAYVADNFDANRAWTLVAGVAAAYMLSRGIAKAGKGHMQED